jgi:hypothetical protein
VGCLFWLLLLCVVLVLFLVNLGRIKETLERTNFNEIVKTQREADGKKAAPVQPAPKVKDDVDAASPPAAKSPPPASDSSRDAAIPADPSPAASQDASRDKGGKDAPQPASNPKAAPPASPQAGAKPSPKGDAAPSSAPSQPKQPPVSAKPAATAPARSRLATLYFVRIDDDGVIVRQEVKRQVPASDQPLTDALQALLGGPTDEELRRHLLSLLPQGTKLLSAQVKGSTAFLNFNEAFMYNHYGIEGYAGQLKQVVYTATAFSSVQDVQILIEGEKRNYLGGEGVFIGKPLSRNSF